MADRRILLGIDFGTPASDKASSSSRSQSSSPSLHYIPAAVLRERPLRAVLIAHAFHGKRCPHLLRLSPLSKAPPESTDHPKRAESNEHGYVVECDRASLARAVSILSCVHVQDRV